MVDETGKCLFCGTTTPIAVLVYVPGGCVCKECVLLAYDILKEKGAI